MTSMAVSLSFFFSSRRRHTSSLRDWSSDVCSSDLSKRSPTLRPFQLERNEAPLSGLASRSEERRVGKECRSRRAPHQQKKKKPAQHPHNLCQSRQSRGQDTQTACAPSSESSIESPH